MDRFWKYKLDHVIFWVATVGFHMFTRRDLVQSAGLSYLLMEGLVRNGLLGILIYTNLGVLVPRYARKDKGFRYGVSVLLLLFGYVACKNAFDVYLYGYVLQEEMQQNFFYNSYYNFSIAFFYLAFSVALHLSKAWYFQREQMRKMEVEKLNAELDYLRAQINPHFVFNSLNTIYFQIDRENEVARQALSNFSEMLRYQLYECNDPEIAIEKEIGYIKSYVAMQRMRKDENYSISFAGSDDMRGFNISPLLLIPFVENAFKHVSHRPGGNAIRISMARSEDQFRFLVFNTREISKGNGLHTGIGLKNVRRRLELLYPDRHDLKMVDSPDSFEIELTLHIDPRSRQYETQLSNNR